MYKIYDGKNVVLTTPEIENSVVSALIDKGDVVYCEYKDRYYVHPDFYLWYETIEIQFAIDAIYDMAYIEMWRDDDVDVNFDAYDAYVKKYAYKGVIHHMMEVSYVVKALKDWINGDEHGWQSYNLSHLGII